MWRPCGAIDDTYEKDLAIVRTRIQWAWLAAGRANLLLHGRERIWDYTAGVLLLQEAGGKSETFDAESVFKQTLTPRSVVAASNPELFEQWASRIQTSC